MDFEEMDSDKTWFLTWSICPHFCVINTFCKEVRVAMLWKRCQRWRGRRRSRTEGGEEARFGTKKGGSEHDNLKLMIVKY